MKRKSRSQPAPAPPPPWFRLRCAACACLAAGVWIGVFAASPGGPSAGSAQKATAGRATGTGGADSQAAVVSPVAGRLPIVIDPGHGGKDPGKVAGAEYEKTWTLQLSLTLAEELRRRGFPVELTRTEDATLALEDRSALANREPRGAFVSIHFNSGKPEASGIEVYYAWPKVPAAMLRLDADHRLPAGTTIHDDRGRLLAEALQVAACEVTGARNRGARNDPSLAVLNRTLCPAVLIECGFLTNTEECRNIMSEEWRRKLAAGLAGSLEQWLDAAAETPGYGISYEPAAAPEAGAATAVIHAGP